MKLYVDKMPQFHKARPVPYVIKDKIEDELQRLREDGIIEPVTFSKWAVPIVPVRKGTGVRICGDYKVIVISILCREWKICMLRLRGDQHFRNLISALSTCNSYWMWSPGNT